MAERRQTSSSSDDEFEANPKVLTASETLKSSHSTVECSLPLPAAMVPETSPPLPDPVVPNPFETLSGLGTSEYVESTSPIVTGSLASTYTDSDISLPLPGPMESEPSQPVPNPVVPDYWEALSSPRTSDCVESTSPIVSGSLPSGSGISLPLPGPMGSEPSQPLPNLVVPDSWETLSSFGTSEIVDLSSPMVSGFSHASTSTGSGFSLPYSGRMVPEPFDPFSDPIAQDPSETLSSIGISELDDFNSTTISGISWTPSSSGSGFTKPYPGPMVPEPFELCRDPVVPDPFAIPDPIEPENVSPKGASAKSPSPKKKNSNKGRLRMSLPPIAPEQPSSKRPGKKSDGSKKVPLPNVNTRGAAPSSKKTPQSTLSKKVEDMKLSTKESANTKSTINVQKPPKTLSKKSQSISPKKSRSLSPKKSRSKTPKREGKSETFAQKQRFGGDAEVASAKMPKGASAPKKTPQSTLSKKAKEEIKPPPKESADTKSTINVQKPPKTSSKKSQSISSKKSRSLSPKKSRSKSLKRGGKSEKFVQKQCFGGDAAVASAEMPNGASAPSSSAPAPDDVLPQSENSKDVAPSQPQAPSHMETESRSSEQSADQSAAAQRSDIKTADQGGSTQDVEGADQGATTQDAEGADQGATTQDAERADQCATTHAEGADQGATTQDVEGADQGATIQDVEGADQGATTQDVEGADQGALPWTWKVQIKGGAPRT